ncbi:MAG: transcriptional repressor NrdR [Dehalococcoidia bacterium]|nr:transcriptional repressor NrdR [Dehalococcoidia bacterium]
MHCPYCNYIDSRVVDSRNAGEEGIRRRRECQQCGLRFTTYERIQTPALMVLKRDGRREEFNRDKLLRSLRLACAKRPLPSGTLEKIVQDIEAEVQSLGRAEVPAHIIGEMVMKRLQRLDRVAYIRFASVYRDFQDLDSFKAEVETLLNHRVEEEPLPTPQLTLLPLEGPPPRKAVWRGPGRRRTGLPKKSQAGGR